jgi:hypothetical protein
LLVKKPVEVLVFFAHRNGKFCRDKNFFTFRIFFQNRAERFFAVGINVRRVEKIYAAFNRRDNHALGFVSDEREAHTPEAQRGKFVARDFICSVLHGRSSFIAK